jgi:hypothetical protein
VVISHPVVRERRWAGQGDMGPITMPQALHRESQGCGAGVFPQRGARALSMLGTSALSGTWLMLSLACNPLSADRASEVALS